MAGLPLVLAGPIVRRVTARSVSVWVALSESSDVTLSIWNKIVSGGTDAGVLVPPEAALFTATRHTIRIGAKLHIAVVTITLADAPAAPLSPGSLYSYNLGFKGASGSSDLKSLGLLVDSYGDAANPAPHLALGYQAGVLPTFVTPPPTIEKLNLVHASCRRVNAPGNDSLATLDNIIRKAVNENDPDQRPHQLFLTGDQIYADEVPTVLIPAINKLGSDLLGVKEDLSAKKANNTVGSREATMANFPASRRQRIVQRNAKFTTGEGANHLLSFGEYAATYLMYWNVAVWSNDLFDDEKALKDKLGFLTTWDTDDPLTAVEQDLAPAVTPDDDEEFALPAQQRKDARKKHARVAHREEVKNVIAFRAQLPNVRRVLANVAVYMIMDDHEVTDDWYLTKDWRAKVLSAQLGVNIVRNALMAYALFQGWGNDPDSYAAAGPKADLLTKLAQIFPAGVASGPVPAAATAIDALFGFDLNDETPPPVKWHYAVPSSETTVYVLDTRTRRTYETRYSPPGLLSDTALDEQIPLNAQPGACQIFISPAPVLGLAVMEELAQPTITLFSPYGADPEAWALNPVALEKFLGRLQQFTRVVLLSGDIHFGLTSYMDYWKKNAPTPSRFVQFVSSAARNQKFAQEQFLTSGFIQRLLSSLYYPGERLGWKSRAGLTATNPANKINPPSHRIRLRREPVLLPVAGWPANTTVNKPPDWSWRLNLARDERPDDSSPQARPEKIRISAISPDVNPLVGDPHAAYRKVLVRHMEIFEKAASRRVMWDTHVGIIKFSRDGAGKLTAAQQLCSWLPGEETSEDPDSYLTYSLSLEPTADPAPVIS